MNAFTEFRNGLGSCYARSGEPNPVPETRLCPIPRRPRHGILVDVTATTIDNLPAVPVNGSGSSEKRVLLLKPRGFCAGVVRAIDIVKIALETFGAPIYVRKEIVHNRFVVNELAEKGAAGKVLLTP